MSESDDIPLLVGMAESVLILGCIKNGSPLPPEFWRGIAFPPSADGETMEAPRDADAPSPGMQAE